MVPHLSSFGFLAPLSSGVCLTAVALSSIGRCRFWSVQRHVRNGRWGVAKQVVVQGKLCQLGVHVSGAVLQLEAALPDFRLCNHLHSSQGPALMPWQATG